MLSPNPILRRDFFTHLTVGTAAWVSACNQPEAPLQTASNANQPEPNGTSSGANTTGAAAPAKTRLGVALLGLGKYAGERLAPGLQKTKHCGLVGLVTGTPSKVPTWREKYAIPEGNVYSYDTLSSMANNKEIDVVYVVTPTSLHAKYAIAAAETGKHVWCEKPMAMTVGECQSIIDACVQNGVKLSIGYRMQHEPNTRTVIEYAKSKPYGAIRRVEVLAGYAGGGGTDWRFKKSMGGGALYDMGVYSINGIRYAAGEEPIRVKSAAQRVMRPELFTEVDETTEFELEFPSGVIGYGRTSVGEEMNVLTVDCERGSYELKPMQAYDGVKGSTSDGKQLDKTVEHQQAHQMDNDALAILEGRPVMVPGEEGLRDIRLVQAIIECARTGQPVTIG
jgi:glucose-fructose oxidoreductase